MSTKPSVSHRFSRAFAIEHGVPEAIVAKFIAHKVRKAEKRKSKKTFQDGKYWFFNPITKVAEKFPYFERSALADTLKRLETKKLIQVGNYNTRKRDQTRWYTVPQEVNDAVEKNPLIRVDLDAANISICAGVLIAHMRFELLEKPAKTNKPLKDIYIAMSPAMLARSIPFDAKTIKRTLDKLDGWVVKHPTRKLTYTLPELLNTKGTIPDIKRTEPDDRATKPDGKRTEPDEKWTKPDDVTHCKPLETLGSPFGKPFKEEAQASPAPVFESNSGQTDDNVLARGPASPQDSHLCSPSSTGIKGCAGHATDSGDKRDAGDEMDAPLTYKQLKAINGEQQALFQYRDPSIRYGDQPKIDPGSISVSIVRRLSRSFVDSLPNATIRAFAVIKDMDQLVAEVRILFLPHFQSTVQQHDSKAPPFFKTAKPTFFRASLEFVVNSIVALRKDTVFCCHSIDNLSPFIYDLELVMFGRLYEENGTLMRERYEENKRQHASVDQAKESDPDLAPAEKARVLRNALQARNAWGYIDHTGEFVDKGVVVYCPADLEVAEKLFELNRGFCVGQLLEVIDKCVQTHIYAVVLGKSVWDEKFHARQGYMLDFFLKHASKIAGEYGLTVLNDWVPLPEPVEEEKLVKAR
ncbi:MAG: hypothetical protein HZA88_04900 [Verrucomicrobia bacterium]|nr:hypothetical protein [Verrucomicrobiota bacterium]